MTVYFIIASIICTQRAIIASFYRKLDGATIINIREWMAVGNLRASKYGLSLRHGGVNPVDQAKTDDSKNYIC